MRKFNNKNQLMKSKYILGAALLACATPALAQETYSGYFSEGYEYRYRMNPAFGNESVKPNFVAIPMRGNVNVAMRGNLHVSDVVYPLNGKTVLFTNPGISNRKVMNNLSDNNRLGLDMNMPILATGFKAFGGYNTVVISAHASANAAIPKDLFRLLKEGVSNKTYDISDVRFNASAYAEIALGHSRDINSQWRVGGALKFNLGIADFDARLDQARLQLGEDNWTIQSRASLNAAMNGLKFKMKADKDNPSMQYVDGIDMDNFGGLTGFGMALDLGAVFTLNQDWQFSAAVLDFGFMNWSNNLKATTDADKIFETDRYTFDPDDDKDNPHSFDNEWKTMRDDLEELYKLEDKGKGSRTNMLAATLNFGARYTFPLYRPLTFGLVNTTHINGKYTWTDFRLSANVAPVKMFSATANLAVGTYGAGFGWLLNYHYTGFGLFVGMDHTLGKLSKDGVPLNSNASMNFGMNILF